jgi:hypothetical protein
MMIPVDGPAASRGKMLRRNFHIVGFIPFGGLREGTHRFLTSRGRIITLHLKGDTTLLEPVKPQKVLALDAGERLLFRL